MRKERLVEWGRGFLRGEEDERSSAEVARKNVKKKNSERRAKRKAGKRKS